MGDVFNVEDYSLETLFEEQPKGNQLLQQQAYSNQDFLDDRPEIKGLEIFENKNNEMFKNKEFIKQPRSILTGYNEYDYFYNPATTIYNKSI